MSKGNTSEERRGSLPFSGTVTTGTRGPYMDVNINNISVMSYKSGCLDPSLRPSKPTPLKTD